MRCDYPKCAKLFESGEMIYCSKYSYRARICQACAKKELEKPMPNIKITAEVDGKQVPLEIISTETFEAIKALEKSKEIPVARLATLFSNYAEPRLIIKPTHNIQFEAERVYVLDLTNGQLRASWSPDDDHQWMRKYKNVNPL